MEPSAHGASAGVPDDTQYFTGPSQYEVGGGFGTQGPPPGRSNEELYQELRGVRRDLQNVTTMMLTLPHSTIGSIL